MKKIIQDRKLLINRLIFVGYDILAVLFSEIFALLIRFDGTVKEK